MAEHLNNALQHIWPQANSIVDQLGNQLQLVQSTRSIWIVIYQWFLWLFGYEVSVL